MDSQIDTAVQKLASELQTRSLTLTAAESCTGGLIAKSLTDLPGSSSWFRQAWITYSNEAKNQMLGVSEQLLEQQGAVSAGVVEAMAKGALLRSGASIAVAVSGIAGPGGATAGKPVGTVWIAWASDTGVSSQKYLFAGDRQSVRAQATLAAVLESVKLCESVTEPLLEHNGIGD